MDWTGIDFCRRGYVPGAEDQDIVPNNVATSLYRAAKINLNHHRTTMDFGSGRYIEADVADSLNPRAYELAACGAFQLCDDSRPELKEVFGESVPTYKAGDSKDLEKKLRYYLDRPDKRAALAQTALSCVLPHSWDVRAAQVLEAVL